MDKEAEEETEAVEPTEAGEGEAEGAEETADAGTGAATGGATWAAGGLADGGDAMGCAAVSVDDAGIVGSSLRACIAGEFEGDERCCCAADAIAASATCTSDVAAVAIPSPERNWAPCADPASIRNL